MTGYQHIATMRRGGHIPRTVVVVFDPDLARKDWHAVDPRIAYVAIEPKDKPSRLDLRALAGLPVVVMGYPEDPVKPTVDAIVKAGGIVGGSIFGRCPGGERVQPLEHFEGGAWRVC